MRWAYFPGCSARGTCHELDRSTRALAAALGLQLVDLPDPGCTGAREFRAVNLAFHRAANARILSLAEACGLDLMVVCDTCLLNLTEVNRDMRGDPALRQEVNRQLSSIGRRYDGGVRVKHLLWVLMEDLGPEVLRRRVVRPLRGLRVGPYYGCHILRPREAYGDGPADSAALLDACIRLTGAEPVGYPGDTACCGFHILVPEEALALSLAAEPLRGARRAGIDCLVTPCPLCHTVMDGYQPSIPAGPGPPLPILHLSQLVGLAIGLDPAELGLGKHVVAATRVLAAAGFIRR